MVKNRGIIKIILGLCIVTFFIILSGKGNDLGEGLEVDGKVEDKVHIQGNSTDNGTETSDKYRLIVEGTNYKTGKEVYEVVEKGVVYKFIYKDGVGLEIK